MRQSGVTMSIRKSTLAILGMWAVASVVLLTTTVSPVLPRAGILVGGIDFDTYRDGARHLVGGLPLYAGRLVHDNLYTYPPFSTLVFVPLWWLPRGVGHYIWMGVNLVALVAIIALCWRILGYTVTRLVVAASALMALGCTFVEPVRSTLYYGQINLILLLLVLWDTSRGKHSRLKGIGVGVAAGIKLTPAYFVAYYMALRQWRPAAVSVATLAATVALGWIATASDSWKYWSATFYDDHRVAATPLHQANQSLRGMIGRIQGGLPPKGPGGPMAATVPSTWVWLVACAGVVIVSMTVVALLYRFGERLLAVTLAGLSSLVVSPFSWAHHWVWVVPLFVYLVHRALSNHWWWVGVAALFLLLGAWPYRYPADRAPRIGLYLFPDRWVSWYALVNLYVVLYAVVLFGAAVLAVRKARPRLPRQDPFDRRDDLGRVGLGARPEALDHLPSRGE